MNAMLQAARHSQAPGHSGFDFALWSQQVAQAVEAFLQQHVGTQAPADLAQAMRWATLGGGKRLRPLLVMAAARLSGMGLDKPNPVALRAAVGVELIHAYSLVHDDMPCMDNDDLRRGKPTVHKQFGQAGALLAGDALQALAFEVLTPAPSPEVPATLQAQWCATLARAAGASGMAGGQAIDLAHVGKAMTEPELRQMHRLKTGALLLASVQMGAAYAAVSAPQVQAAAAPLERYGLALGLAFQVVDDVLDVTADAATLGKTPGKDAAADKPTYVSLLGLGGAQALAQDLAQQALAALDDIQRIWPSGDTQALSALVHRVVHRNS